MLTSASKFVTGARADFPMPNIRHHIAHARRAALDGDVFLLIRQGFGVPKPNQVAQASALRHYWRGKWLAAQAGDRPTCDG